MVKKEKYEKCISCGKKTTDLTVGAYECKKCIEENKDKDTPFWIYILIGIGMLIIHNWYNLDMLGLFLGIFLGILGGLHISMLIDKRNEKKNA